MCTMQKPSQGGIPIGNGILELMKKNLGNIPKWQYVGTEDGTMYLYPTVDACNPLYDPRLQ